MAKQDSVKDEDALNIRSIERYSPNLVKVTTYIREDQACALEMIQTEYGCGVFRLFRVRSDGAGSHTCGFA